MNVGSRRFNADNRMLPSSRPNMAGRQGGAMNRPTKRQRPMMMSSGQPRMDMYQDNMPQRVPSPDQTTKLLRGLTNILQSVYYQYLTIYLFNN